MESAEIKKTEKQVVRGKAEDTRGLPNFIPAVDIYESKGAITIIADMPGVSREGVSIDLKDDQLTINGKVTVPKEEETVLHREYEVGNYFRQFTLSDVIDQSKIAAKMSEGVLTVTLPKAAKAVPRRIEISAG